LGEFTEDLVDGLCGVIFSAITLIGIIFTYFQIEELTIMMALPALLIWIILFAMSLTFTVYTFLNKQKAGIMGE
jgi:hypothetical protein